MSDLPREFNKRAPANLTMMDLPLLLKIYDYLVFELEASKWEGLQQAQAIYNKKLSEVKAAIELEVFGEPVRTAREAKTVEGLKPEDIDLSQFEEKTGDEG